MKKFLSAVLALALLSGPAFAQADARSIYTRTNVVLAASGVTPAAVDTILTFQKQVGNLGKTVLTTGQTSYTVTLGKTLRIQGVYLTYTQSSAVAARVQVFLRINTAGACVAASPLLLPTELAAPSFGTAAANTGSDATMLPILDGYEIRGDGTLAICFSAIASSAAGTLTLSLVGYEY
jgi:hypothetical protein